MAFTIKEEWYQEMALAREAELSFSREVKIAQFREAAEMMRWTLHRPVRQVMQAMRSPLRSTIAGHLLGSSSTEVEDKFRPSRPNYLYLLAEEARDGDYRNHERFLNTLGHEATGDTLLNLEERLRITFNPQGSNTREWWLEPSGEAAYWLKKRIADEPRPDNFVELDPRLIDRKQKNLDRRKFLEPELREFMMRETLYAILPQRQAEIAWLYVQFHDEDRPRETTKAIAEFLQISPATVRWHKAEALKSPQFKKMLGLS